MNDAKTLGATSRPCRHPSSDTRGRPWWSRRPPGPRRKNTGGRPRFAALLFALALLPAGPVLAAADDLPGGLFLAGSGDWEQAPVMTAEAVIDVAGMVGRVEIRQSFANLSTDWVEGVYLFPLPDNAAVDTLELRIGERRVLGEIREREEAVKTYRKAVAAGRQAGLVEQDRPNLFSLSVANIPPGESVYVHIGYFQQARYEDGQFELDLPLTVTPRYLPQTAPATVAQVGAGGTKQGSPAVTAFRGSGPGDGLGLSIRLRGGLDLAGVDFPGHEMARSTLADGSGLTFAPAAGRIPPDRDFRMRWAPTLSGAPAAAVFSERFGDETYALIMLMPPHAETPVSRPREVILVIDTSGSMAGESIRQARAALARAIERLGPEDRFNVIEFNDQTLALFPGSVAGTAVHRDTALAYIRGLQADGGTEMAPAIELALAGESERLRQVVFVTDGAVGNEEALFALIRERLGESRLFTVGIGAAPNGHFMTQAARWGRGTHVHIAHPAEVRERIDGLLTKLERPALTDISVEWPGGLEVETWPDRVADLYAGEPLLIAARLRRKSGAGMPRVNLAGRSEGGYWLRQLQLPLAEDAPGAAAVWARGKLASLERRLLEAGDPATVRAEMVSVALEHGLVSRYTSLVAVDEQPVRRAGERLFSRKVPLVAPAGASGIRLGDVTATATEAPVLLARALLLLLLAFLLSGFDPRRAPRWD